MPSRAEILETYAVPDRQRSRVRMNFIASADGAVTLGGRSGALGGSTDRAVMETLRTIADVVLVGAGTVRTEGYGGMRVDAAGVRWRRDHGMPDQPALAVVSGTLGLPADHEAFIRAVRRPAIVTTEPAARARGAEFAAVADVIDRGEASLDLAAVLTAFAERGWTQVLCEGGPQLFGALLEAGLVAEVCLTIAPRFVGGAAGRIVGGAAELDRTARVGGILTDDEGFVCVRYLLDPADGA
jgi:riboflavin biosynthesis pyrimidine reductase